MRPPTLHRHRSRRVLNVERCDQGSAAIEIRTLPAGRRTFTDGDVPLGGAVALTIPTIDSQHADVQIVGKGNRLTVRAILTRRGRGPRKRPYQKWKGDTAVRSGDEDRADDHVDASRE